MTTWLEWNGYAICIKCASDFFTESDGVLDWDEFETFVQSGKYYMGAKK